MKKKTLLNAIIVFLLIIMGVSVITAAFMVGEIRGLVAIGIVSFVYLMIILFMEMNND